MRYQPLILLPVAATIVVTANAPALADSEQVQDATRVFQEFMNDPDQRIPPAVLQEAQGIAILTNVARGGFFLFGGRGGDGVLVVRDQAGGWSNPVFINIAGGSFGPQFGGQTSDTILVFRDQGTVNRLLQQTVTLGGDVAAAAGPSGSNVISPISSPRPQIYSYSRSRGLFAGVSLTGADISIDRSQTEEFYGRSGITPQQVFLGQEITAPPVVANLQAVLNQYTAAFP